MRRRSQPNPAEEKRWPPLPAPARRRRRKRKARRPRNRRRPPARNPLEKKADMASSARLIVSILVIAVLALAFWMLALAPKREKADELGHRVEQLKVTLAEAQGE